MKRGGLVPPFFHLYFSNLLNSTSGSLKIHFYQLLEHLASFMWVIPLTIGLARRKYFNTGEKILFGFVLASALFDVIGFALQRQDINNMFLFHIYIFVEFTLISLFYVKVISNPRLTPFIIGALFPFLVMAVYEFITSRNGLDVICTTTESIVLMLYAILGFSSLLKNPVQSRVVAIPLFWFNTAVLLYFAGNLFLFVFGNYIQSHYQHQFNGLWRIHSVMSILFYLLIGTGFWKTKAR